MSNLIKIGHLFLNIDLIQHIDDQFAETREDKVVVHFGPGEGETLLLTGRDADDLRTWLNSVATNLHEPGQFDSGG